jgi:hypothetical protein
VPEAPVGAEQREHAEQHQTRALLLVRARVEREQEHHQAGGEL